LFKAVESKLRSSQTTKTIVARFATCRAEHNFSTSYKGRYRLAGSSRRITQGQHHE
jgi:hypothetical protein